MRDNPRRVDRAAKRARRQEIQLRHQLAQAQRAPFHLAAAFGGERACCVFLVRAGERLAVFGDGVPDDEQAHGGQAERRSGTSEGRGRRTTGTNGGRGSVVSRAASRASSWRATCARTGASPSARGGRR